MAAPETGAPAESAPPEPGRPPGEGPERDRRMPVHMSAPLIGLVAVGGAAGSLARYGVGIALSSTATWPVATLAVNVVGSFCLGLLLEALSRRGPEARHTRELRLGLGTGLLGGFTTFSSFAVELERLADAGRDLTALAYGAGTLTLGLVGTALGVAVAGRAARLHASRERHPSMDQP